MKRYYQVLFLTLMLSSLFISEVFADEKYLYPDNKDKDFISAAEHFKTGNLKGYIPIKNADKNIEQKLLYKDLKYYVLSIVNDNNHYTPLSNIYLNKNDNISPNRQIYLYLTVLDSEKEFRYQFLILDAETKESFAEGNGWANNIYSKEVD
ncbi:hypothetical protein D1B31_01310 [Neobacillus notoginsengisoli]|uniref:Uncharacterized protein n=1 Tax=Neobacillus notoginsengisoli TaxID=1578198 RepID=A0A417YZZ7_9BACI|nr:hypothetical protein [Neobacillus notoginsengisoli]RHW43336.1 hypothetical protein D1B31_01310 [Neobacillus notoginsengisoli]